jgi:dimethylamine/trimethylamine dehydrogenase
MTSAIASSTAVLVTARLPDDRLYTDIQAEIEAGAKNAIVTLKRIGDCYAPASIQAAVYAGHRYARELDDATAGPHYPRELPSAPSLRGHWGSLKALHLKFQQQH